MATEQENLDIMIEKIQNRLGIQIDSSSFDYEFLKVLNQFSSYLDNKNLEFLNAHTFENLKDDNLDGFLNYFNMYRTRGNNNDVYEFELMYNSSQENISIKDEAIFSYNNEFYRNIRKVIIGKEKSILYAQKIFTTEKINNPIFSINGVLIFDNNSIEISNPNLILSYELPKKLKLISYKITPNETESDISFMERSKSVLQNLGYSNLKKIELTLLKDTRIKSVYIDDQNGYSNIIIFPNNLSEIDEIIKYNNYVVDYFKSSKINLLKPNVVEVNLDGLKSQLFLRDDYEIITSLINSALNETLSLLKTDSNNNLILSKTDLIYAIKNVFDNYNDSNLSIDYNQLNISTRYYFRTNYKVPISIENIYDEKTIESTDVITLGFIE
jgi:hypothetical protein